MIESIGTSHQSPYPGLRPYRQEEADIFFGRVKEICRMLERLENNFFLAVVGSSGSGKSSLVKAGLLPAIKDGYLFTENTHENWTFLNIRPEEDPIRALATEFVRSMPGEKDKSKIAFTRSELQASPNGLVNLIKNIRHPSSILLLIDQFEEIFRYQVNSSERSDQLDDRQRNSKADQRNQAIAFVNLILHTIRYSEKHENSPKIYVVITMRSDFIGHCESFEELAQVVSTSQFLVPLMKREQIREAIEKPLSLFGWSAESELVNEIINDAGSTSDQLPLMQHALMRTWLKARKINEESKGEKILTRKHYKDAGGIDAALSEDLEAALGSLNEVERRVAQILFVSLCERNSEGHIIRRPVELHTVTELAEVEENIVKKVVRIFQDNNRNFITAAPAGDLIESSLLDISHEALLRQWKTLGMWFDHEQESADTYRRLVYQANQWAMERGNKLSDLDLKQAENWRRDLLCAGSAWGSRYNQNEKSGTSFRDVERLLEVSRIEQDQNEKMIEERNQEKERNLTDLRKNIDAKEKIEKKLRATSKQLLLLLILSVGVTIYTSLITYTSKKNQQQLYLGTAKLFFRSDPEMAIKYVLASMQIQPLPWIRAPIDMVVLDSLSSALELPSRIPFESSSIDETETLPDTGQSLVWSILYHEPTKAPEDQLIITGGADGWVKLWDAKGNLLTKEIHRKQIKESGVSTIEDEKGEPVLAMGFLDKENLITGTSQGSLIRWKLNKEKSQWKISKVWEKDGQTKHAHAVQTIARLNDKEILVGDALGNISRWSIDGNLLSRISRDVTKHGRITAVLPTSYDEFYAAGIDGSITQWRGNNFIARLDTGEPVRGLIRTSDGFLISASGYGNIQKWSGDSRLWNSRAQSAIFDPVKSNQGSIKSLVQIKGDKFVTTGTDGTFTIWQDSEQLITPIQANQGVLMSISASADGNQLFAGGSDGKVSKWNLSKIKDIHQFIVNDREITSAQLLPENAVITGDDKGHLVLWNPVGPNNEKGKRMKTIKTNLGPIKLIAYLEKHKVIFVSGTKGRMGMWDVKLSRPPTLMTDPRQPKITGVVELENQKLITSGENGTLIERNSRDLRETTNGSLALPKSPKIYRMIKLTQTHNKELLIGGLNELWQVDKWKYLNQAKAMPIQLGKAPISSLLELSDSNFLIGTNDGRVYQWNKNNILEAAPTTTPLVAMIPFQNETLIGSDQGSIYSHRKDILYKGILGSKIRTGLGQISYFYNSGKDDNRLTAMWKESKSLFIRRWENPYQILRNSCLRINSNERSQSWPQQFKNWIQQNLRMWKNGRFTMAEEGQKEQEYVDQLVRSFCENQINKYSGNFSQDLPKEDSPRF